METDAGFFVAKSSSLVVWVWGVKINCRTLQFTRLLRYFLSPCANPEKLIDTNFGAKYFHVGAGVCNATILGHWVDYCFRCCFSLSLIGPQRSRLLFCGYFGCGCFDVWENSVCVCAVARAYSWLSAENSMNKTVLDWIQLWHPWCRNGLCTQSSAYKYGIGHCFNKTIMG